MACSKVYKSDTLGDVMSLLDQVVTDYRNRGHSRTLATEQAALALGITTRRAQALLYGQAFKITREEYRAIKAQYMKHLDAEAESLSARFQAVMAKRLQMEMDI